MEEYVKKDYTSEELVEIAIKRIKLKRSLYMHIASYVFVNSFLIFLYGFVNDFDYLFSSEIPWIVWPLAGWGLGLLFNIFNVIQDLHFKYNTSILEKELKKVKKNVVIKEGDLHE